MMRKYNSLAYAMARVTAAPSVAIMYAAAKELAGNLGYTHLMMALAPANGRSLDTSLIYSDSKKRHVYDLDRSLPYTQFPSVEKARKCRTPFTVKELQDELQNPEVGSGLPDHLRSGDNLMVPVYDGATFAALAMYSGQPANLTPVARSILMVSSHQVFATYRAKQEAVRTRKDEEYSSREMVCLTYLGRGMKDAEIGRLLGITQRTVRFHIDNVKVKLEATSRVQAISKAISRKLISL